jgi:hypothetical protein
MMVETECGYIFVDGISVVRLQRSDGRPGSSSNGFSMLSYNLKPLGWVGDGDGLIESVVAAQLFNGQLDPHWEEVPTGSRLIHPRYTLNVEKTPSGWLPKFEDGLTRRMHSLRLQQNQDDAMGLLEELLRRRDGRTKPREDWKWWLAPGEDGLSRRPFQLALRSMLNHIAGLVRTGEADHAGWFGKERASALDLAGWADRDYKHYFDPVPRIGAMLATYIKSSLIDLYRGSNTIQVDADGSALIFTQTEISAFRERFRRSPMTDREYLDFVNTH